VDPVDRLEHNPLPLLRREVGMFRARESRRVFDAAINVGVLAGPRDTFVARAQDIPIMDAALRVDVVSALIMGTGQKWRSAWLCRAGGVEPHDTDFDWLRASTSAFAIHSRTLNGFYVVTRTGWREVRTGEQRIWKRLRL
jgi:hypothetical protein